MNKSLEDGYDILEVTVSKTIQEVQYEPLHIKAKLSRMVSPDEVSTEFQDMTELLHGEIEEALGISEED